MREIVRYKVSDLRERISESVNRYKSAGKISVREAKDEFEPVYGKNVQTDNKKINSDAYKEISKETEAYNGGLTSKQNRKSGESVIGAANRGMSDLRYDSISEPFKEKVKSQLKGYTSAEAEKEHKNDDFGNAYYGDDKTVTTMSKHAKDAKKEIDKMKTVGLTGSKYKKETEESDETMFESKKINKIQFKNTQFLSESHMLTKVPDEFKFEGKKFIMKDSSDNEYLVEWTNKEPNVTKKLNKTLVKEEMSRIKQLYGYESKNFFTSTNSQSRINEEKGFSDMLNKARELMK